MKNAEFSLILFVLCLGVEKNRLKRRVWAHNSLENELKIKGNGRIKSMIKGIHKNMIVVQTPKSVCFEEVYFILRHVPANDIKKENEMLREANRILAEHEVGKKAQKEGRHRLGKFLVFFFGALCGSLAVALLWGLSAFLVA